jgi:hypothetical protein
VPAPAEEHRDRQPRRPGRLDHDQQPRGIRATTSRTCAANAETASPAGGRVRCLPPVRLSINRAGRGRSAQETSVDGQRAIHLQ